MSVSLPRLCVGALECCLSAERLYQQLGNNQKSNVLFSFAGWPSTSFPVFVECVCMFLHVGWVSVECVCMFLYVGWKSVECVYMFLHVEWPKALVTFVSSFSWGKHCCSCPVKVRISVYGSVKDKGAQADQGWGVTWRCCGIFLYPV